MDSFIAEIGSSLLKNTPELMAWLFGIVLAVVMLRRGGARAEKLLLAGCSLVFLVDLINPLVRELVRRWMSEQDMSYVSAAQTIGLASLPMTVLSLAGLVCLVWAFWMRFRKERREAA